MDIKFNINQYAKVKLTHEGALILEERHNELYEHIKEITGKPVPPFELRLDADGYYANQLWSIMETFGSHIYNGCEMPFDGDILLLDGEPIGTIESPRKRPEL